MRCSKCQRDSTRHTSWKYASQYHQYSADSIYFRVTLSRKRRSSKNRNGNGKSNLVVPTKTAPQKHRQNTTALQPIIAERCCLSIVCIIIFRAGILPFKLHLFYQRN